MTTRNFFQSNIVLYIFWACIAVFVFFYFGDHLISPDEGFVLNEAWQVWNGKKMYSDFLEYITPGSGYAVFFIWKILGTPSYLSAKIFAMLLWLMSAVFIYFSSIKIFKRRDVGMAAVVLWLFAARLHPIINHNIFSTYFSAGLFYFLLSYFTAAAGRNKTIYLYAAGLFAALTFLFLQTKGLAVFAACFLAILLLSDGSIISRLRQTVIFSAAFLFISLLPLLYFNWGELFYGIFIFPNRAGYMDHTYIVGLYIFLETIIALAVILVGIVRKNKGIMFLGIFQAALFLSCFNFLDLTHFLANSFPFWIFAAGAIAAALRRTDAGTMGYALLFLCALTPFILSMLIIADYFRSEKYSENHILFYDILGKPRQYIFEIPEIKKAELIYSGPFYPGLYFEYRKPNPFHFFNLVLCDEACQNKVLDTFKQVGPEFAFLNYQDIEVLKYDIDSPVDYYIRNNYFYCQDLSRPPLYIYAKENCPPCPAEYICNDQIK